MKKSSLIIIIAAAVTASSCSAAYQGVASAQDGDGRPIAMKRTETLAGTRSALRQDDCEADITTDGKTVTITAISGVDKGKCLYISPSGRRSALRWEGTQSNIRLRRRTNGAKVRQVSSTAYAISSITGYYGGYNSGASRAARDIATAASHGAQAANAAGADESGRPSYPKIIIASDKGGAYGIEIR